MTDGLSLKLHSPRLVEKALEFGSPWDGPKSAYAAMFQVMHTPVIFLLDYPRDMSSFRKRWIKAKCN